MAKKQAAYWQRLLFVVIIVLVVLSGTIPPPTTHAQDPSAAYQEALDRIQAAKDTDATALYLVAYGLSNLPPEIGELTNLRELYLGNNALISLPPEIDQLTNLQTLDLQANALESRAAYQEAIDRIQQAKDTGATILDLTGIGLVVDQIEYQG